MGQLIDIFQCYIRLAIYTNDRNFLWYYLDFIYKTIKEYLVLYKINYNHELLLPFVEYSFQR